VAAQNRQALWKTVWHFGITRKNFWLRPTKASTKRCDSLLDVASTTSASLARRVALGIEMKKLPPPVIRMAHHKDH
jgi:hypothetical protein